MLMPATLCPVMSKRYSHCLMLERGPLFGALNVNHTRIPPPLVRRFPVLGGGLSSGYVPTVPVAYYDFKKERTVYSGGLKNVSLWNLALSVGLDLKP